MLLEHVMYAVGSCRATRTPCAHARVHEYDASVCVMQVALVSEDAYEGGQLVFATEDGLRQSIYIHILLCSAQHYGTVQYQR